ncbi:nitroreductase [Rurimicrobium arvi]
MHQDFSALSEIIVRRRNIKPAQMNGQSIPEEQIVQLLHMADWAPTHGRTEPWRFYVFAGDKVRQFCADHAEMRRKAAPDLSQESYDRLSSMGDKASHVILAVMRRGHLPKIPQLEEVLAVGAALQNLWLSAESLGIAVYWGTGGSVLEPEMKEYLSLREEDLVVGALYLGYTDEPVKPGTRNVPVSEKIHWM